MTQDLEYTPQILVSTDGLPRDKWLEYRRLGIGGSDAAAVLGISPFRTGRDLYFDKLGIATADDDENWVAKEVGTLLEPLVARIFSRKTGLKIFQRKVMYQHPSHPWMLADLDYLVEMPDGSLAILECKTCNFNARFNWWREDEEIVPVHYEVQGRHYMAVTNISRVYFCCLYGNNEEEAIIRHIDRDMVYETELIALEDNFWNNNVLAKVPPPYIEDGDLILESLRRQTGVLDDQASPTIITPPQFSQVSRYLQLQEEKSIYDAQSKQLEKEMTRVKGMIVANMGHSCKAVYEDGGTTYTVTFNPVRSPKIYKEALERMEIAHPEIYEQYVTMAESRRFHIKRTEAAPDAA